MNTSWMQTRQTKYGAYLTVYILVVLAIVAGAMIPFWPLYHVPWILFLIVGFLLWRRMGWHHHHQGDTGRPSSVMEH